MKESTEFISGIINQLPYDLRMEVVMTDLLKNGFDARDIFIKPIGTFARRFGRDIHSFEDRLFESNDEFTLLNINREGLYDMLPQALFHHPPGKEAKAFKTASEMADEVKVRKKEEKESRDFFHLYEIELYHARIAVEFKERKMIETISITMDDEEFLAYWSVPAIFNKKQKGILFYLYPIINSIRGNLELMQHTYNLFFEEDIEIKKVFLDEDIEHLHAQNKLGEFNISSDFVLGSTIKSVFEKALITIGPVAEDKIVNYIDRSRNMRILKQLNRFFMPLFFETEIVVHAEKTKFKLSTLDNDAVRLGMNSYL
jgi:hypothetical protein